MNTHLAVSDSYSIIVSLKDGGTDTSPPIPPSSIRASVQSTIDALGFTPDLFLIHNPFVVQPGKLQESWKVLEDLKDEGVLKSIGVSNFRPQDLEEICPTAKHLPVVNQVCIVPSDDSHFSHKIIFIAGIPSFCFDPFGTCPRSTQSRYLHPYLYIDRSINTISQKYKITTASYGPLSPLIRHPTKGGPLKPILERIGKRLAIDSAAVLMLYIKAKGAIAVSSSADEKHIKETVALNGPGMDLMHEEVEEIESVGKGIHFRAYDEHMCTDFPAPEGLSA